MGVAGVAKACRFVPKASHPTRPAHATTLPSPFVRRPRAHLPAEGIYHVTARGVARTTIFLTPDEHRLFLRLLADVVRRQDWQVHVFCLMPNHYHLVVETKLERLSQGLHRLNGVYAQGFNHRHQRNGHLFGDRYAAWVVEDDAHYRNTCEYVLQNPVRAGLVAHARDWPWSAASGRYRTLVRVRQGG
jgi:putative transposase